MRFCDKLPKIRKDNNLSQEQLADRLGVSRQAVSKWEQGLSYPDMDKIIQMCNILNCTLEDLLDDGTISKNVNTKNSINDYFQEFLKFITDISNMFTSMTFKQKIKCFFELCIIFIILFLLGMIIYSTIDYLLLNIFLNIPKVGIFFHGLISNIMLVVIIIIGIIVFIHLFKVRYLDYYVTIEDSLLSEKVIEEPIDKGSYVENKKQEKIIIRDPKHSKISFFNVLLKLIIFSLKLSCVFISIFAIISFIVLLSLLFVSLVNYQYGLIFVYISLVFLGLILINYCILEIIYKFVVSLNQSKRRMFILFIIGLLLIGGGIGLSLNKFLSFSNVTSVNEEDYIISTEEIKMRDDLILDLYYYDEEIEYVIDDEINNIKLEIKHLKEVDYYINEYDSTVNIYWNVDFLDAYNLILNDFKNEQYHDHDGSDYIKITVVLSKENYEKISNNYKNYLRY